MIRQITTFTVRNIRLGLDILLVKEIHRHKNFTPVPGAPDELLGLLNLRGKVVTVVDLNTCINRPKREIPESSSLLILKTDSETEKFKEEGKLPNVPLGEDIIGLLIDKMESVMDVSENEILPAPPNLTTVERNFIEGVIKVGEELVILLDITALLKRIESSIKSEEVSQEIR